MSTRDCSQYVENGLTSIAQDGFVKLFSIFKNKGGYYENITIYYFVYCNIFFGWNIAQNYKKETSKDYVRY